MKSETGYELITSLIAQLIFHYWPWIIDFYLCYVNVLVYATFSTHTHTLEDFYDKKMQYKAFNGEYFMKLS